MQNKICLLVNEPDLDIEIRVWRPLSFSYSLARKCNTQVDSKLVSTVNSPCFKPNLKIERGSPILFRIDIWAWIWSIEKPQKVI
jgi:hypothetical protein